MKATFESGSSYFGVKRWNQALSTRFSSFKLAPAHLVRLGHGGGALVAPQLLDRRRQAGDEALPEVLAQLLRAPLLDGAHALVVVAARRVPHLGTDA